ncbi:MAG: DUF1501 domain-containing protein [Gammaproteobacteria bacterium]
MNRRDLLRKLVAMGSMVPLSNSIRGAWAGPGAGNGRAVVVVFLRGGCDGLNMVVPHGDGRYYAARPHIAIPPPRIGGNDSAINIDGYFGLHPALRPLQTSYAQGRLALLPAVHFPESTRSHFHAQAFMERAGGSAGNGWLNRYLLRHAAPSQALAIGTQLPEALQGEAAVPAYASPLDRSLSSSHVLDDILRRVLTTAYIGTPGTPTDEVEAWRVAAAELESSRTEPSSRAATSVTYPDDSFGRDLAAAAALLRDDPDLSIVMLSMGGWDTHSNQGGAAGRQATQLATLAAGLSAFEADLGTRRDDVAVLVQTEFGRTFRENASGGTDHGGASAWMVLSSTLRGGIHLGHRGWPGLDEGSLLDGRALAPTIDFRDVYADLLTHHLGCTDVSTILPDRPGEATGLA